MTVVSSTDFAVNQKKYLDMALDEQVFVQNGEFYIQMRKFDSFDMMNTYHDASVYEEVLRPDDDLRRAITGEELLKGLIPKIEKLFDK